jgi:CRP/FNR family cyclic AMP-dependent transcriptional regulator
MSRSEFLKSNDELIKLLKQFPVLKDAGNRDFDGLLKSGDLITYHAGELIFQEGSDDSRVYFLVSGQVRVVKHGRELMVLRRTGDFVGKMGTIEGLVKSASVYAIGPCTCLAIDISKIDWLSDSDSLAFKYLIFRVFSEVIAKHLKITTEELRKVSSEVAWLKSKSDA